MSHQHSLSASSSLSYANVRHQRRPYNYPNAPAHGDPVMGHGRAPRHQFPKQAPYSQARKTQRAPIEQPPEWQMRGTHAHDTSLGSGSRSLQSRTAHAPSNNPMMHFDDVSKPRHRRKTSCNAYVALVTQCVSVVLSFVVLWAHGWARTEEDHRDDTEIQVPLRGEYGLFFVCYGQTHDRPSQSCVAVTSYFNNIPG